MLQCLPWIVALIKSETSAGKVKKVQRQMNVRASSFHFLWTWVCGSKHFFGFGKWKKKYFLLVTINDGKVSVSADTETKYSAEYPYCHVMFRSRFRFWWIMAFGRSLVTMPGTHVTVLTCWGLWRCDSWPSRRTISTPRLQQIWIIVVKS